MAVGTDCGGSIQVEASRSDGRADRSRAPEVEAVRLHAVERYRVLDAPPNLIFTRIGRAAAGVFDVPMAAILIAGHDRIVMLGVHGFAPAHHLARHDGFFESAMLNDRPHVVADASSDAQTSGSKFVEQHQIRLFACAPIVNFQGQRLGAVAVMDTAAGSASDKKLAILADLAAVVMEQLELRLSALDAVQLEQRLRGAAEYARDDARRDRDDARHDRDEAQHARDTAWLDRDLAEQERDLIEQYATVLQRTLLPPTLPKIDGLSLACLYHPASTRRVGGDFYDVFALNEQRWAFFIGDVQGHGAEAAVATSLIRYTLRAAALHEHDLTQVLAQLNLVLLNELEPRRFCTVLFGVLSKNDDGQGFDVTLATGGHPPALLLDPAAGATKEIRSRAGMLVGAAPGATFDSCQLQLHPGQTLLLYTDGIVESRRAVPPFDHESLAAFAGERAALGATGLINELATLIPKLDPDDDVALLAITTL